MSRDSRQVGGVEMLAHAGEKVNEYAPSFHIRQHLHFVVRLTEMCVKGCVNPATFET